MKRKTKIKTVDGKEVLGFQFIPEENVYIGFVKGEKSSTSEMWSSDKVHITRSNPKLNIAG